MDSERIDITLKIVILGECGTGKSSLVEKYCNDKYISNNISTIGVDFFTKIIEHTDKKIKLQIWDTAGQEKFYNLVSSYFRDCCMGILVFDICNKYSFDKVDFWISEFEKYNFGDTARPVLLVGSKVDIESMREVSPEEGFNKAEKFGCEYIECSAKENINIDEIFQKSINIICNKINDGSVDPKTSTGIKINNRIESFYMYKEKEKDPTCCTIL
tara:strand:- start:41 stop:685 length:645 start_codon:yes stop_codon:yes gene_type:complete